MEKIIEQGILYDFYGPLLTKHQQAVFEAFVYDNMSLAEIADEENVSRQAVHDIVKRCDTILNDYENKLGLVAKFQSGKKKLEDLHRLTENVRNVDKGTADRMNEIIGGLMEEW